jgi:hypothetical protein
MSEGNAVAPMITVKGRIKHREVSRFRIIVEGPQGLNWGWFYDKRAKMSYLDRASFSPHSPLPHVIDHRSSIIFTNRILGQGVTDSLP